MTALYEFRPKPPRSKPGRPKSMTVAERDKFIRDSIPADLPSIAWCIRLDALKIPIPEKWKNEGCLPTFRQACTVPPFKERIRKWKEQIYVLR